MNNKEYDFVKRLIQFAPRSPEQINSFFLSDAEVIKTEQGFVCATVDTISEELSMELIQNAQTLGWLSAVVSFSDLAALGVPPQSLSIQLIKDEKQKDDFEIEFKKGLDDACKHYQVKLTEYQSLKGSFPLITSTASSLVSEKPSLFRTPLKSGDLLYLTGPLGWGNAVAFANVALRAKAPQQVESIDQSYRPMARVQESQLIKDYAHVCLDTSDGGLFSFDLLAELNRVHININYTQELFHPLTLELSRQTQINPFIFFAAQNGEFELLFAISPEAEERFLSTSRAKGFSFLKAGRVEKGNGLSLSMPSQSVSLNMKPIQNLLYDRVKPDQYILALLQFAASNKIEAF